MEIIKIILNLYSFLLLTTLIYKTIAGEEKTAEKITILILLAPVMASILINVSGI